jgi:hypothetical protein
VEFYTPFLFNVFKDDLLLELGNLGAMWFRLHLSCTHANKRRYNSSMLKLAFLICSPSIACCRILYSYDKIIFLHTRTLSRLSAAINIYPSSTNDEQAKVFAGTLLSIKGPREIGVGIFRKNMH